MQSERFRYESPSLSGLVSLVLVLILAGIVLFYAQQRQQDAVVMALKVRQQQWQNHLMVLQQRWEMQHRPAHWRVENQMLRMTSSGWPITKTSEECESLWRLLLAEEPAPLISLILVSAGGCEYQADHSILRYNYQRQSIVFSENHE